MDWIDYMIASIDLSQPVIDRISLHEKCKSQAELRLPDINTSNKESPIASGSCEAENSGDEKKIGSEEIKRSKPKSRSKKHDTTEFLPKMSKILYLNYNLRSAQFKKI